MAPRVYTPSVLGGPLRQGELISGFTQYELNVVQMRAGAVVLDQREHPFVVVLSQDCDLEHDFGRRSVGEESNLSASVLFCGVHPADDAFRHGVALDSKEWKRVKQNKDPRFHYVRGALTTDDAAGHGFGELVIDFRQFFAVPTLEAYYVLESAVRRCRLETPYAEHLSVRFASYISRIALPLDHHLPWPSEAPIALPAVTPASTEPASEQAATTEPAVPPDASTPSGT